MQNRAARIVTLSDYEIGSSDLLDGPWLGKIRKF